MTKTPDFTKAFENMFTAFPTDMKAFTDAFQNTADFSSNMAKIALEAAEKKC